MVLAVDYARAWWELRGEPGRLGRAIRLFPSWRRSLNAGADALSDRAPWITFDARFFLDAALSGRGTIVEYGSGGSTLYYAKRCQHLVSIEHDPHWFERVCAAREANGITNCRALLVPPRPREGALGDPSAPGDYASAEESDVALSFRAYASAIDELPDRSVELVSVDGRARPSCIQHAHPKVQPGGYLLLDNSERPYYWPATAALSGWARRDFYGPGPYNRYFWRTTIWRRPLS